MQEEQLASTSPDGHCGKKYPNFFNAPERIVFPAPEAGDVDTQEFLRAVEDYVKFYQSFGVLFKMIIQDALGQLEAMRKVFAEHTTESKTLRRLLKAEKQRGESNAALQLLWLARGLRFYSTLLELMYDNARLPADQRKELSVIASTAYNNTLCQHHGFFTRNTIKLAYKTMPYHATINQRLWYGPEDVDELVLYSDAMAYRGSLPDVIHAIHAMYEELNLDTSSRAP
ncbi:Glycolipid transfer protein domain [Trinorchestia longiramus]|nr:Glycolipid transfer protein domain [Trinorchestia longiramus]